MNKKILFTVAILGITYLSKAQTWSTFGTGISNGSGGIYGLAEYNGNLYVGGFFGKAGGNPAKYIAQWNGTSWSSVGTGFNAFGYTLVVYNSNLYAGGNFDSAGGNPAYKIAEWNGINWSALGTGMNISSWGVGSIAAYNGNLYAAGSFDSAGGQPANNIAEWNGTNWSTLGSGLTDTSGDAIIYALAVYNGELYAAGMFDTAGGIHVNNIAKWNGTNWSAVGSGIWGYLSGWYGSTVYALCVYEGNLYAAGNFDTAGGIPVNNIAMWNGTNWSAVGAGMTYPGGATVEALAVNNHELFAGGTFNKIGSDTVNDVAQWDGNQWYPLTTGIKNVSVFSLGVYNSALVAGGQFDLAGSTSCSDIAEWIGGPLPAVNICYVTVDTASKYNEVLWDKTGVDTNLVDSFRVYSKGVSGYQYLGSVSVHNFTQFVDSTSQPNTVSSTYEICTVDTSGLLSQLTPIYNQTILLQANVGVGNVVNLSWNPYIGDSVSYYLILRDSLGNGNWQRLDSVPNNIYAYTDNHPPISPNVRYIINTIWNLNCVPYSNAPLVRTHNLMNTNIITSRSNRKQISVTGIPTINAMPSVTIYPNPSKDIVTITLSQPVDAIITLNDVLGQTIYTDRLTGNENSKQINLSGLRNGVYFLKLALNNGGELVRKIDVVR